ncbi:hypothetical protein [Lactobacillus taiwanensis]|uniref:hypothetical protein n=1 Tax=Lactobacillus taiwanensis TaxID=508451 RepID=UPI001AEBB881|nr:hypothetical protein [Lactobacillus taiwanensis]QTQ40044.1 hypothetical protein H1A07_00635 [Lactobacillus taiwanensis]
MKRRTTMLMSALFVAGAFAVSGNVAKADTVQANNGNAVNSTDVKQNNTNASANQVATKTPSKEELKDIAMKQYHAAIGHMGEEEYQTAVTDPDATGTGIHSADGKWLAHVDTTDLNWSKMNSKLNNAKNEVDAYLNDAVQNKPTLANTRKNATDSLKKVPLPTTGNILDNLDRQEKDKNWSKYDSNVNAVDNIWNTIENPYLATLLGARHSISNSDYKNEENSYSDKLAELVARNVRKDKNWVLANTDPNTIEFGKFTFSPDNKDEHGRGEGETDSDSTNNTENKTVIPWFVYNKELIKVDKDAYNRVHGSKSNENSSDTGKDQTTTDTNKNSNSQVSTKSNSSKTNEATDIKKNDSTTVTVPTDKKTSNSKSETSTTATQSGVEVKNVQTGDSVKNSANPQVVVNSLTSNKSVAQSGNVATKSNAVQTVALSDKVNTNKATANHASTVNNGKVATSNEKRLPQAGTDEKISLFASLAGLSIASLGLGALGVDRKRKNN